MHGGRFHRALGSRLERLSHLCEVVPADVLDAWFPPAPSVVEVLTEYLPVLARTAPPANAEPLVQALSEAFQVDPEAVLPGAGSSALIYHSIPRWVGPDSTVWAPDPGYGEYRHIAQLVGARIEGFGLWSADDDKGLRSAITSGADLAVIINPNNPTGWKASSDRLQDLAGERLSCTRIWIDEAYASYTEVGSLASYAASNRGVFVSRTLSKSHALSGLRVACLIGHPDEIAPLRSAMPPWSISFPAQLSGIYALRESRYYQDRYLETAVLRTELKANLAASGLDVLASEANWILFGYERAKELIEGAEAAGVYLRDPSSMSSSSWPGTVRVAVRSAAENVRVWSTLRHLLQVTG